MHGLGNDFIIIDERPVRYDLTPARIAALSDRHRGIGCDQLVLLRPACAPGADVFVRFFNADGSEAGACGNASRCVARLLADETGRASVTLQTRAGLLPGRVEADGRISVNMGAPRLAWDAVPLTDACDTLMLPIDGSPAALSMGNPHVTFFVDDLASVDPAVRGAPLERHALFAEGANIGFAQRIGDDHLRLRVWERGAGLTLACGSGACAAAVNAMRKGLVGHACRVTMDGGDLDIVWERAGRGDVWMTGPAVVAFDGHVALAAVSA